MYRQEIGTSMGSKPAPDYSNIFMARKIDPFIKLIARKYTDRNVDLKILKRFLDDIFTIFLGTTKNLHKFIEEINKIHPAIKFTMAHTSVLEEDISDRCSCPPQNSIPFLDVSLSIKDGRVSTDLYKKPTDRNQYLLTSSCHPNQTKLNIPFSLALRIVRICSVEEEREQRFAELKSFLMEREYTQGLVNSAIN